jgi:5-formyltetrahydrofolate cyclo-ligase
VGELDKDFKDVIRGRVWSELMKYAKPDSRFHYDFNEFIPDFSGSEKCVEKIINMDLYREGNLFFIAPDNSLELLRYRVIIDRKSFVMPTYGIKRGFLYLDRAMVPEGKEDYASTLDGAERFGRYVGLREIGGMGRFDALFTGASVVSIYGVRYGKGHGYFDLEWGMLREIGSVDDSTPIVVVVHDVQVIDIDLPASHYDTVADYIVTPTKIIKIESRGMKPRGIDWSRIREEFIEGIPPLKELRELVKRD